MSPAPEPQLSPEALADLSALLRAAREDAALRGQILTLVRLPVFQRNSLVASAVEQMTLRGEPARTRAAFSFLATAAGCTLARDYLACAS